ncbi:MAG: MFS transporter [Dehalococcoidales bacterium]|nr:MFS transporter [Dehalococcoidales bacterium]
MYIPKILRPKPTLSEEEIQSGLRWMTREGTATMSFFSVTGSGILVAFALALGANNFHVGVLAAIPFIMQIVQIPAVWLIEKVRLRKFIVIASWFPSMLFWIPIALIPFLTPYPGDAAITLLLVFMAIRGILAAICNTSWNGWQRDLVPQSILGRFYSRRLSYSIVFGIIFSLGSAFFIDRFLAGNPGSEGIFGYTWVILFCAVFLGMAGPVCMLFIPEPLMQPLQGQVPSLTKQLSAPIKDHNFRKLLIFLFFWSFASNLAIPFFSVHMLERLGLPVTWVIGLSILSQVFSVIFLRVWGTFADRFSNKSVLSVGISLYLLVIFGWIFTAMPDRYVLTLPLLVILHIFAGIAGAAVSFTVGTIGLKLSPRGQSTSYLATASLAVNVGSGLGPLLGGSLANFFSTRQLNFIFNWSDLSRTFDFTAMNISDKDFLFGIAFILGLFTLGFLAVIREEGESSREVILNSLISPAREFSRPMNTLPALSFLSNFNYGLLKRLPLPGLDVAFGVTIYQIAEAARATTSAAIKGRRVTRKLAEEISKNLLKTSRSRRKMRQHGTEVIQHTVRGAMHIVDEKPVKVESLIEQVLEGVMNASEQAGIEAHDAVMGVSQGVVQGAVETGVDISEAVKIALKTVKKVSSDIGISEEEALSAATEGVMTAAEPLGSEVVAEVVDAVPDKNLISFTEESERKEESLVK